MPDNENVIFGAEFDPSLHNKGVDAVISKLEELKLQEVELGKEVTANRTLLRNLEEQLAKVRAQYAALDKASKDYGDKAKDLAKQEKVLVDNTKVLNEQLSFQEKQLKQTTASITNYNKAVEAGSTNDKKAAAAKKELAEATGETGGALEDIEETGGGALDMIVDGLATGLLAVAIPALVSFGGKLYETITALDQMAKNKKIVNEVLDEAAKSVGREVAQMEIYRSKLTDLSIPESERLAVLVEYNKTADTQNQIDATQINNLGLINDKLTAQIALLKERAVAVAAINRIGDEATKLVDAELALGQALRENSNLSREQVKGLLDSYAARRAELGKMAEDGTKARSVVSREMKALDEEFRERFKNPIALLQLFDDKEKAEGDLQNILNLLSPLVTAQGLTGKGKPAPTPPVREIENVFRQKLLELRARLATVAAGEFQSEGLIKEKFDAQLQKEYNDIGRLLRDKKLTVPQSDILKGLLQQINNVELSKSLEDFRKKQRDALQRIDDAILTNELDAGNKRVANIREAFEREAAQIENNYQNLVSTLNKRLNDLLRQIDDNVKIGFIPKDVGEQRKVILRNVFGDLLEQAGIDKTNREIQLSFKIFQDTLAGVRRIFQESQLTATEATTALIQAETQSYLTGAVTFEQYQKKITKILRDEARARRELRLTELREELQYINARIQQTSDPEQLKALQAQQLAVRTQIASVNREIAGSDAEEEDDESKKKVQAIIAYANALNGLLQQVASFWQRVNAVEAAALERSISLQERRVQNAKEIAEKGNAEYLELEQKRLDELERKREENARRQLAINNALVLSQALVAAISAIATATQSGSPLAAIAAVGAVIGAIGAAYAFAQSLEPVSANFYEGTEFVKGAGRPLGKDTVPANLTIGERVITERRNREYWDTLHAVHNGHVPASVLNQFVNSYTNPVPSLDFARLSDATQSKVGFDTVELANELKSTNRKLDLVYEAISGLDIGIRMDEDGFSASLKKHIAREALRKRS